MLTVAYGTIVASNSRFGNRQAGESLYSSSNSSSLLVARLGAEEETHIRTVQWSPRIVLLPKWEANVHDAAECWVVVLPVAVRHDDVLPPQIHRRRRRLLVAKN